MTTRETTNNKSYKNNDNAPWGIIVVFGLILFLSSCVQPPEIPQNTRQATALFRPPTPQIALVTPTFDKDSSPDILSTPEIICKDQLVFIQDITIPDGTIVPPDSTLDKRWEVENSGNCNWDKNYRLRLIAGTALGALEEQALYPARTGSRVTIRIVFKAPIEPGSYHSAWQAFNPSGEPVGDPFFIEFVVQ